MPVCQTHWKKKKNKLWTRCPIPCAICVILQLYISFSFSLPLSLWLTFSLSTVLRSLHLKRWTISHLLGVLIGLSVGFCFWQLTKTNFWVQFHALIVLDHLLIILRVSARYFPVIYSWFSFMSFCRLQHESVSSFGKSLCECMPNFNVILRVRVCVCVYGVWLAFILTSTLSTGIYIWVGWTCAKISNECVEKKETFLAHKLETVYWGYNFEASTHFSWLAFILS